MIEAHADNNKTIGGLFFKLSKTGVDCAFVMKRAGIDVQPDTEFLRGGGEYSGILALAGFNVIGGARPAHPVAVNVRTYKYNADEWLAGSPRLSSEKRGSEIEHACLYC